MLAADTPEERRSCVINAPNSSKLLLVSRSCVREVSTSSVGLLPSCLPPLHLTLTVPVSLSLSPTTGHKEHVCIISISIVVVTSGAINRLFQA
ncbi:hypothetical protein EYF80_008623 [Liparis tanakae]|uniref:Uncharacterized protein n=1 Tax=Liparis tanakae TaxID=230148 RepID=A0A4Z2IT75_9TELE|nr:hypothetical protein EYF80_008623 [Liparis tanakae]